MSGVLLGLALSLAGCRSNSPSLPAGSLEIEGEGGPVTLAVEIAETDEARQRGLMGRTELDPGSGMVFLFDRASTGGFWMRDTLIPLDIAFWAAGGGIVDILHMTPCRADPCRLYAPDHPYVGAIEANLGFFAQHGIRVGDFLRLRRAQL